MAYSKNKTLWFKIMGTILASLLIFFILLKITYDSNESLVHFITKEYRADLLDTKKQHVKDLVRSTAIAMSEYLRGIESKEELTKQVRRILTNVRYGKNGFQYFFVYDCTVNIFHVESRLLGKDLAETKTKEGKFILKEACRIVKNGGGFYEYPWVKPNVGVFQKIGYFVQIPGTPFWIGTGTFSDEIEIKIKNMKEIIQENNNRTLFYIMSLFGLIAILVVVLGCLAVLEINKSYLKYHELKTRCSAQLKISEFLKTKEN